ncbi:MAG: hypothetical protein MMC23_001733 [Stictis urceolatum]|nr:hypothetical protein [Stictis urceolata]
MSEATALALKVEPCANVDHEDGGNDCSKRGILVCANCKLMQYCSKECQKAHWPMHKTSCKSPLSKDEWKPVWIEENRQPAFVDTKKVLEYYGAMDSKVFWSEMLAIDIIKLQDNEKSEWKEDLHLLFAASGDLGSVLKTVAAVPDSYEGALEIAINDDAFDIVARNTILLLLALTCEPEEVWEAILHLWYSVLVPKHVMALLEQKVAPLLDGVCSELDDEHPLSDLFLKAWKFEHGTMTGLWLEAPGYLKVPENLSAPKALELRSVVTMNDESRDYADKFLCTISKEWRFICAHFRQSGILAPFASSRRYFDTPNPTFFHTADSWPMDENAEALNGWSPAEVHSQKILASNNLYGKLYAHLVNSIQRFCIGLSKRKTSFLMYQVDAVDLWQVVPEPEGYFDRVEVSNLVDSAYLGTEQTLKILEKLLKPSSQNPHATLIALYKTAVRALGMDKKDNQEISPPTEYAKNEVKRLVLPSLSPVFKKEDLDSYTKDTLKILECHEYCRDCGQLFREVRRKDKLAKASQDAGLVVKDPFTIVELWPMRLRKESTLED